MLFNSIDFAVFLPIVFIIYWITNKFNKLFIQNSIILIASYVFYGWWDWRFLSLIVISTIVDYSVGLALSREKKLSKRKLLLFISIFFNIGFLGFFKYYNFFLENFISAFSFFGHDINTSSLNIILPVGISFYTFQTLSYTIDIYRKKLTPTKNIIDFSAFVSFFPQLVAGPIERASNLLPQFYIKKSFSFEKAKIGILEIAWGLFKKIVIADNLAYFVNIVYADVESFSGFPLLWATIFFTFQIYCDFSGYSSIAIGTAKLFGFDLMTNFRRPYLSTNFKEFWSRWHISLSSWFKDYVYIPLGGNRNTLARNKLNIFITFIISGFWHGANWTFIIWGAAHGFLNSIGRIKLKIKIPKLISIFIVFFFTMLTWVIFRADNVNDLFYIYSNFFQFNFDAIIGVSTVTKNNFIFLLSLILLLFILDIVIEYYNKRPDLTIQIINKNYLLISIITILIFCIYSFGVFEHQEFIYFQF